MRSWRRRILIAGVLILAVAAWHASRRVPAGPEEMGDATAPSPATNPAASQSFRVGTFNIHGGKGADGRRDLARTAGVLGGLDLVGLNEVHGAAFPRPASQVQDLGLRLASTWLFAPAENRWYGYRQFGNGLLTRLELAAWRRIPLPRRHDRSCRNMLVAEVRHGGRPIRVVITHLARRDDGERQAQLRTVIDEFLALPPPSILLGDLNSPATDPQIQRLRAMPGVVDPIGQVLGGKAPTQIDWIFVRGLEVVDAGVRDEGVSDHPLLWAELKWTGE